jgi:CBS domain containing-hemolysin-like protein
MRVRGTVRLSEVGQVLGVELQHPRVTTVSGLVLLLLGRPAAVGDQVTHNGVHFEVTGVAGRGVSEAVVSRGAINP